MKNPDPIHLIIVDPSQNVAEELASELRNAGHATRAQHVSTLTELDAAIARQRWDMVLCRRDSEMQYDPKDVIARVLQNELDCPVLLLEDGRELERLTEGLASGATDVLLEGEDDRFMLVLRRELANLAERRGRRHAELAMTESERRNQLLLDSSRAAIAYVHEGMHIYANRAYVDLFGYGSADDLAAMPLLDMIARDAHEEFKRRLKQFDVAETAEAFDIQGRRLDGSSFGGSMTLTMAAYDGEPCMQVLIRQEQSADNASSAALEEVRAQDPVTGLLNRPYFLQALDAVVEDASRGQGMSALLDIALDSGARIREDAGPSGHDDVLRDVAGALRKAGGSSVTLARMSDDGFAAVLSGATRESAAALGERIRADLEDLLAEAGNRTVRLTASVGIALIDKDTASSDAVLDQAARAVSRIRETHKAGNAACLFDPADFVVAPDARGDADDEADRRMLRLLSDGIKNNTLVLLYQPIVSLRGEEREHYEVYLRLPDGEGNLLRPDEFMQLAEQAGMGGRVDRWVVLNSVKKLTQHRAKGHDARITINLTHAALTDDSFLPWLRVALKAAKLPKEAVILQYSEAAATTYLKQAKLFGEAIGELDCLLALSHFGRSVNPFGTLRHLQVEYVKLDGSFITGLEDGDESRLGALREMITALEDKGKVTVLPMVSTPNLLASLFSSGANYVQGHYFGEPSADMDYDFAGDQ